MVGKKDGAKKGKGLSPDSSASRGKEVDAHQARLTQLPWPYRNEVTEEEAQILQRDGDATVRLVH